MRRFTRLTNGFSKKIENHIHMVALYTVFYNFTKIHKTLRVTPAMQAGLTDHVWSMEEIVRLLEEVEAPVPAAQANQDTTNWQPCLTPARPFRALPKARCARRSPPSPFPPPPTGAT